MPVAVAPMWLLPELVCGDRKWQLPLSDRLVAGLVLALGEPDRTAQVATLAKLLGRFPPLAVWAVRAAGRWDQLPPASVNALADGLLDVLLDVAFRLEPSRESISPTGVQELPPTAVPDRSSAECGRLCAEGAAWCIRAGWFARPTGTGGSAASWPAWLDVEGSLSVDPAPCQSADCDIGATAEVDSAASDALEAALAAQLPTVLNRLRRQTQLERQFSDTLEQEKLASLRQLAYGASHEINNPLANIAARAQALLQDESHPERRRKLSSIVAQAFRAHEMIADLMLFARPPALVFSTWDAAALLTEVCDRMRADALAQETQLHVTAEAGCEVHADRDQLAVAVQALVRNALEALGRGGTVRLAAQRVSPIERVPAVGRDRRFALSVEDSGPGIEPAVRSHLFDPFYSGREAGRGLGFGLSKAWRIVQEHGGTLRVEGVQPTGARFVAELPVDPRDASVSPGNPRSGPT